MSRGGTWTVRNAGALRGSISVPGDKSISHRALMFAGIASGTSRIRGLSLGDDVYRTLSAMKSLGATIDVGEDRSVEVRVEGAELRAPSDTIDVGNSGTAIRLLAGLAARCDEPVWFDGDNSIRSRPMGRIAHPLRAMGVELGGPDGGAHAPFYVRGGDVRGITYELPVASAQVKSAVLLAGLAAEGATTVVQPAITRAHTEEMLTEFGADVTVDGLDVTVLPSALIARDYDVPGDPSQAAFWAVAASIVDGSEIEIANVYRGPARCGFIDVLARMGADISHDLETGALTVAAADLVGTEVLPEEIPGLVDEVPVLAIAAAFADGPTTFVGIEELRVKESDRVSTTIEMVESLGGQAAATEHTLTVQPIRLRSGTVSSYGDHRIAMAASVAGTSADAAVEVIGSDCVGTSYPGFLQDLANLQTS